MNTNEIIVGLDIGTTKICAIVGRRNEYGKIEVIGVGKAESLGVMRGVVANIDKTVQSIQHAVADAKQKSGIDFKKVYVGIAGQHIKSLQHRGILTRDTGEEEITNEDIHKLINDMYRLQVSPGDRIIHVLPQEFIVDNVQGIKEPVGMCGVRLEANFHIITGQIAAAQNINRCVQKAGLEVADLILEPLASASAVLSEEEKEAGVALVDIGGGTTDIALFQDGIIRHTAVIPFGGNVVTEDIKEGCMVMKNQAEVLKTKFGSALATETQDNEIISIPGLRGREPKEISVKNLAHIIQARMEEIIEQVYFEIRSSGYSKKLIGGIVLTGGGSQLKNLVQLVEYITGLDARVGYPTEHLTKGMINDVKSPGFSTGIGLIIRGYQNQDIVNQKDLAEQKKELVLEQNAPADPQPEREEKENAITTAQKWNGGIFRNIKKWFEDDIENDF